MVDHNVVRVHFVLAELLDEPLRLKEGQEFGDADTDKGGEFRVAELVLDVLDVAFDLAEAAEDGGGVGRAAEHAAEGAHEAAKLGLHALQAAERPVQHVGKVEEAESVAGGRGVEDDAGELVGLRLAHDLGEGHCLVDARQGVGDILNEAGEVGAEATGASGPLCLGAVLHGLLKGLGRVGVDFHAVEVGEAVYGGGLVRELLAEGIAGAGAGASEPERGPPRHDARSAQRGAGGAAAADLRLCAGSVDTMRTFSRDLESCRASRGEDGEDCW